MEFIFFAADITATEAENWAEYAEKHGAVGVLIVFVMLLIASIIWLIYDKRKTENEHSEQLAGATSAFLKETTSLRFAHNDEVKDIRRGYITALDKKDKDLIDMRIKIESVYEEQIQDQGEMQKALTTFIIKSDEAIRRMEAGK